MINPTEALDLEGDKGDLGALEPPHLTIVKPAFETSEVPDAVTDNIAEPLAQAPNLSEAPQLDQTNPAAETTQDDNLVKLVEKYESIATKLANHYKQRGVAQEDLLQVARLGLLKAIKRYDPGTGNAFTTFAYPTINGELKRYFRDQSWAVQVPRALKQGGVALRQAEEDLTHEFGRKPTVTELAERLGKTEAEVLEIRVAGWRARFPDTLDAAQPGESDSDKTSSINNVYDPHTRLIEDVVTDRSDLRYALSKLDERGRTIVSLRFAEGHTQTEIAEILGISQVHVSRLLAKNLDKLRELMAVN